MQSDKPVFRKVDARCFRHPDNTNERARAVEAFIAGQEEQGFVALEDPALLPSHAIGRMERAATWLFSHEDADLLPFSRPDLHHEVGFTGFATEKGRGTSVYNANRYWHVRLNQLLPPFNRVRPVYRERGQLHENVWPVTGDISGEVAFYEAYRRFAPVYTAIGKLAAELFERGLDLPPGTIQRMFAQGETVSRLLHYPAKREWPRYLDAMGVTDRPLTRNTAHVDCSAITILPYAWGTGASGFQVLLPDGKTWRAPETQGGVLVNAGAMLEFMTAGRFRAVPHRVVDVDDPDAERFIITGFFHPPAWQPLEPLCSGPGTLSFPWDLDALAFHTTTAQQFKEVFLSENYRDDRLAA